MRAIMLLAALCAAAAVARADDPTASLNGVVDLTPENFDQHVDGKKLALVEFYAPWCGHCKRMTTDYQKLGEAIAADPVLKSRVVIGKVNADDHKELGKRFGVTGFPTIKWFTRTGEPEDYKGARTADKFLEFIKEKVAADRLFGRVEVLDPLAAEFAAPGADMKAVLAKAEAAAKGVEEELQANAGLYVKAMQKALDKGVEYFATEAARLERMISSGSVAAAKLGELSKKLSVLGAFTEEPAAEE